MRRAFHMLWITRQGKPTFFHNALRWKPRMGSPVISYPAAGTFSISIFPSAPTKRKRVSGALSFTAFAMAMAGKMCPPVPPPLINTLSGCCGMITGFRGTVGSLLPGRLVIYTAANAEDDPEGKAGEPHACSAHTHQG